MASRLTDRKEMRVSLKLTINSKVRVQFLDFTDSTIVRFSSSAQLRLRARASTRTQQQVTGLTGSVVKSSQDNTPHTNTK